MILTLKSKLKYPCKSMMNSSIQKPFILSHIVAASTNHVIGLRNQLPCCIPKDLQFFHTKTKHHVVIMGRRTFDSLGKALPHRINIIISKNKDFQPKDAIVCSTTEAAIEQAKNKSQQREIFIIGGGEIYKQTLHDVNKIYMTRIHQHYKGDAFYPNLPEDQFCLIQKEDHSNQPSFSFLTYERRATPNKES